MRLYHYMDADAYEAMIRTGRLVGSPAHSTYPYLAFAYGWLADVMRSRIGPAPEGSNETWPVFTWAQRAGQSPLAYDSKHNRPRSEDPNDAGFLVGFDVPDGAYLLSDFDDWHYVMTNSFLPSGGGESDEADVENNRFKELCELHGCNPYCDFDEEPIIPEVQSARRVNWKRIVDHPYDSGSVQATVWELKAEWVFLVRARRYHAIKGMANPRRKGRAKASKRTAPVAALTAP
ncbi:DUF3841 domain-containing protein [Agrobacterium salinitolerans]|nr:DUF3841 domain-containing protein [Agrobacterium salinitolerans]